MSKRLWARQVGGQPLATDYSYNAAGDLEDVEYADSTPGLTYTYDRRGRMATNTQNPEGASSTLSLTYNDASQPLVESYAGGALAGFSITNGYDHWMRRTNLVLQQSSNPLIQQSFSYDAASRLQTVTENLTPDTSHSAHYSYLANSPLVSQILFTNNGVRRMTTTKWHDNLNRLTAISSVPSSASSSSFSYTYNNANQRTRSALADNSYWRYGYDSLGQVTTGRKYWGDQSPVPGQQFEYAFDDIGNRTAARTGGDANGANLRQMVYTANDLNQYTSILTPGYKSVLGLAFATNSVTVNGVTALRKVEYFDAEITIANTNAPVWQSVSISGGTNFTGNLLFPPYTQDPTNDADGNLIGDGMWTNRWDAENRLVSSESVWAVPAAARARETWSYLPDGRWYERVVSSWVGGTYEPQYTNRFVWDGQVLLAVLDHTNGLVMSFLRGLDLSGTMQGAGGVGGLLAVGFATNGTHFAAYDGNGNVTALVDAADGALSAQYEYGPFGETIRMTGPVAKLNPIRFSTQFADDLTGDLKYLYRVYDPDQGRWPNRDPIGEPGFEVLRKRAASPLAGGPNRYLFVKNNPLTKFDLLGLTTVTSPDWFPGARDVNDNFDFTMNVNDGQDGTVVLRRITMAEVEAEMKRLVGILQGYRKADGCKSRKHEGGFDSNYFEGENQQHQYYLVDGQGPLYADNQINYIGIGLYEAWLCDSLTKAKAIVWAWKLGKWHDVPSAGTMHWLEVGYNKYPTLKSADDSCCRCPWDDLNTLRSLR